MQVHQLISDRKSIRAFSEKEISDEILLTLFEAARLAPSSMNEQPWRFIIARKNNVDSFNRMLDCLNESNRNWAKHSAVLVLTIANKNLHTLNKPNVYAWHDVGLAIGNLSLQAMAMNIFLHQMGGFNAEKAISNFEIPDGFEPVSIIALGYKGNPEMLSPQLKERELKTRTRLPLSELIYINNFGKKLIETEETEKLFLLNNSSDNNKK
jgi:nitroreductase